MSDMTQAETELRRELGEAEDTVKYWREVLRSEREQAAARLAAITAERDEVRLRRQEMITMCVQLEGEVNTLHQQLTEAQQEIARLREALETVLREARAVANDHHQMRYTRLDEAIESVQQALVGTKEGA